MSSASAASSSSLVFTNACVVSGVDVLANATVVIDEHGIITSVTDSADAHATHAGAVVVDVRGNLLLPGLVNAHSHMHRRAAASMARVPDHNGRDDEDDDGGASSYVQRLQREWRRMDGALTGDAVYLSAMLCLVEALEAGTTAVLDHHSSRAATAGSLSRIAGAARDVGIRVAVAYDVSGRTGGGTLDVAAAVAENARFVRDTAAAAEGGVGDAGRVAPLLGVHVTRALSDAALAQVARLASASPSVGVHALLNGGGAGDDDNDVDAVTRLDRHGLLSARSLVCGPVSASDATTIAQRGATLVLSPEHDLALHGGGGSSSAADAMQLRVDALLHASHMTGNSATGLAVALGSGGPAQDMLQQLRATALCAPARGVAATYALLHTNARVASAVFGTRVGAIAPGYAADLTLFDYIPATPLTRDTLPWHLQYGAKHVDSVWVAGKQLVASGRVLALDKAALAHEFHKLVAAMAAGAAPQLQRFADSEAAAVAAVATLVGHDVLRTWTLTLPQLQAVLRLARTLRQRHAAGKSCTVLRAGGLAVCAVRSTSARTRIAFAAAAALIGLQTVALDGDVALSPSMVAEVIGVRDDMHTGHGERHMRAAVARLDEAERVGGVSAARTRPTLLNLRSEYDHPTRTLADVLHLQTLFGPSLRGRHVCVIWTHHATSAQPAAVPGGLVALLPRFGVHVVLAHPTGFELAPDVLEAAALGAQAGGGTFRVVHSLDEGTNGADVVLAHSWGSTALLQMRAAAFASGTGFDAAREAAELQTLAHSLAPAWDVGSRLRAGHAIVMLNDGGGDDERQSERAAMAWQRASWQPYVCAAIMAMQRSAALQFHEQ